MDNRDAVPSALATPEDRIRKLEGALANMTQAYDCLRSALTIYRGDDPVDQALARAAQLRRGFLL